jgi:hypothetical protein
MAGGLPWAVAVQLAGESSAPLTGTGGTKAAAVQLIAGQNIVATCASAGVAAFILPPAEGSPIVTVENDGASSALVFTTGTDTINALSAGASFSVTNAKRAIFVPAKNTTAVPPTGRWIPILSA